MDRIRAGQFRRDLYYRLNVIAVELPPLRERDDDVLLLANHYIQKFARSMDRPTRRLAPDTVRALREYQWPGNVRELEHAIEHAMILSQRDIIGPSDLPFHRQVVSTLAGHAMPRETTLSGVAPAAPMPRASDPLAVVVGALRGVASPGSVFAELAEHAYPEAKRRLLALFDEAYTSALLRRAAGNMSEAARQAGLDRSNFRRLVKRRKSGT
jgi:DNA-binding NtrC family response regulator